MRISLAAGFLAACATPTTDDPVDTEVPLVEQDLELRVAARFAGQPFSCRANAGDVGASGLSVRPTDLRLYLHDLSWVLPGGDLQPWTLADAAPWQGEGAALLDFETGADACAGGTEGTNTAVSASASAPEGLDRATLRLTLGLPFALSHAPLDAAVSPFDDGDLFVSTTQGRVHFQLGLSPQGGQPTWPVRIFATGCTPGASGEPTPCAAENLATLDIPDVSVEAPAIVLALEALLAAVDLATNATVTLPGGGTVDSPPGCQSTPTDDDCQVVYEAYGLGSTDVGWIQADR